MTRRFQGLTKIPTHVKNVLDKKTLNLLQKDGHGLSFPEKSFVQMRFVIEGKDNGCSYSYTQWGGIKSAIEAAMSRNQQLRLLEETYNSGTRTAYDCVSLIRVFDKRRNTNEYSYTVRFTKPCGKSGNKRFYIDAIPIDKPQIINIDRQFHAYQTAKLFRRFSVIYEANDELHAFFKPWKEIRLYTRDRLLFPWKETSA